MSDPLWADPAARRVSAANTPGDAGDPLMAQKRLHKACTELEGLFIQQLLKAMRATVPQDGVLSGGAGEDMFNAMLDEHLAAESARASRAGLGEALYQRMRTMTQATAQDRGT